MSEFVFELVELKCGLKSLRQIANQETFHPEIGPYAEARILHVEQQKLVQRCSVPGRFVIWDVGLGAAANALCAIEALTGSAATVEIHSFDKTTLALSFALQHAAALGYLLGHEQLVTQLIETGYVTIGERLRWYVHLGDFREAMLRPGLPSPQSIFYDPYSHKGNHEMWTLEHFACLRRVLDDSVPCLLTNYTASTVMRVTWLKAGFFVGIGTAVGKKAQTTVAANDLALLENPLAHDWLRRIKTSHSSTPLRLEPAPLAPMSAADYASLLHHSQFTVSAAELA